MPDYNGENDDDLSTEEEIEQEVETTDEDVRQKVAERDDRTCQVCGRPAETQHHILPRAHGGTDSPDNLITLCTQHHRLVHEERLNILEFEPKRKCKIEIDGRQVDGYITDQSNKMHLADQSHKMHNRVMELCNIIRQSWVELGALLYHIKSADLYEAMGYDTFGSYIADPEVNISRPKANRAIRCVKRLHYGAGIRRKLLEEMGIAKADRISKYWDKPEIIQQLAEIAPAISRSDLNEELDEKEKKLENGKGNEEDNQELSDEELQTEQEVAESEGEGTSDSGTDAEGSVDNIPPEIDDNQPLWLRRLKGLVSDLEPNEIEKLEEIYDIVEKQVKALTIDTR